LRLADELPHVIARPEARRWYAWMLLDRNAPGDHEKARTLLGEAIELYGTIRHAEARRTLHTDALRRRLMGAGEERDASLGLSSIWSFVSTVPGGRAHDADGADPHLGLPDHDPHAVPSRGAGAGRRVLPATHARLSGRVEFRGQLFEAWLGRPRPAPGIPRRGPVDHHVPRALARGRAVRDRATVLADHVRPPTCADRAPAVDEGQYNLILMCLASPEGQVEEAVERFPVP